jgi:hypothetical protein
MKKYKIQNRSQTNSYSCALLRAQNKDYCDVQAAASLYILKSNTQEEKKVKCSEEESV